MTPEEKAAQLISKYTDQVYIVDVVNGNSTEVAKRCALIAVDEILSIKMIDNIRGGPIPHHGLTYNEAGYWQQVKTEIKKL